MSREANAGTSIAIARKNSIHQGTIPMRSFTDVSRWIETSKGKSVRYRKSRFGSERKNSRLHCPS